MAPSSRVVVVPYDPNWPEEFRRSSREVVAALGENLVEVLHIGSTSIPGIHAKPVIDMLAVVVELATVDRHSSGLASAGYQ